MPKEIKYESVAQRMLTERDTRDLLGMLIMILDRMFPQFFEQHVNEVMPRADGEPHTATYTKPQ